MTTYLQDAVTRANSTTVPGPPDVGGPYTAAIGTWGVSTNRIYTSASTANSLLTFPAAINVDFQAFVTYGTANSTGIAVRVIDSLNYWTLGRSAAGVIGLMRVVAGTATGFSDSIAFTTSATVRLVTHDRKIYPYVNGVLIGEIDDQWYSAATSTAALRCPSATNNFFDDLIAVDVPSNPSGDWDIAELAPEVFTETSSSVPTRIYKGRDTRAGDLSEVP